jgi:hypothetical protein
LQAIFSARVADLKELEGVGKHIAEKIYFIANDGFQPYAAKISCHNSSIVKKSNDVITML